MMTQLQSSLHKTCYCKCVSTAFKRSSSLNSLSTALETDSVSSTTHIPGKLHRQNSQMSNISRSISLFAIGVMLSVILNLAQKRRNVTNFGSGLFAETLNCAWWIPPVFGFGSIITGYLYPHLDKKYGTTQQFVLEWPNVMKCVAVFIGINHASARISFDSETHLMGVLAIMSVGLWYLFDRSVYGFGLGLGVATVATLVTQCLVAMEVFMYMNPDFLYMRSWVPCLFFSGGVTVGTIGRALAMESDEFELKPHMD